MAAPAKEPRIINADSFILKPPTLTEREFYGRSGTGAVEKR